MLNKILTLVLFSSSALVANAADDEIKHMTLVCSEEKTAVVEDQDLTIQQVAIDGEEEKTLEENQTAEV